jgi:hypothetical protein
MVGMGKGNSIVSGLGINAEDELMCSWNSEEVRDGAPIHKESKWGVLLASATRPGITPLNLII